VRDGTMQPLFEAILQHVPVRGDDPDGRCKCRSARSTTRVTSARSASAASHAAGFALAGRARDARTRGRTERADDARPHQPGAEFPRLERAVVEEAQAGDIVLINGIDDIGIGCTLCPIDAPDALPLLRVDEPTLVMNFCVNTSPLAGRRRQVRDQPPAA